MALYRVWQYLRPPWEETFEQYHSCQVAPFTLNTLHFTLTVYFTAQV